MPKPNHKETLLKAGLAAFHRRGYATAASGPMSELARTVLALQEGAVLSAKLERGPQPLEIARRTLQRLLAP